MRRCDFPSLRRPSVHRALIHLGHEQCAPLGTRGRRTSYPVAQRNSQKAHKAEPGPLPALRPPRYYTPRQENPKARDRTDDPPPDRLSPEVGFIWIDALCINQDSIPERNAQVALMRDIYTQASRVVIWLGPGDETSDLAIDVFRRLSSSTKSPPQPASSLTPKEHSALRSFCRDREWWDRVWVWQEATTPNAPREYWCGGQRIRFEDVMYANKLVWDAMADLKGTVPTTMAWNETIDSMGKLGLAREMAAFGHFRSEIDIIDGMRRLKATDVRDKVFAFLPLLQEVKGLADAPVVDYGLRVEEVFRQAAVYLLEAGRDLRVLLLCHLSPGGGIPNGPSWVPNFSLPRDEQSAFLFSEQFHYKADGNQAPQFSFTQGKDRIRARGLRVDGVEAVHPAWRKAGDAPKAEAELKPLFKEWMTGLAKFVFPAGGEGVDEYVGGGTLSHAVDRLLVHDQDDYDGSRHFAVSGAPDSKGGRSSKAIPDWNLAAVARGDAEPAEFSANDPATFSVWARNRHAAVFRTKMGYLGSVNALPGPGDVVVVIFGLRVPLVLRPVVVAGDSKLWMVVGPCYAAGIMDGEIVRRSPGSVESEEIEIC